MINKGYLSIMDRRNKIRSFLKEYLEEDDLR